MTKVKVQSAKRLPWLLFLFVRLLHFFSSKLTLNFLTYIFTKPINYKTPEREAGFLKEAQKSMLKIPTLNKTIACYRLKNKGAKIVLVHGWSSRASIMFKIALTFHECGYDVYSFDAPAHKNSSASNTALPEFIESLNHFNNTLGPFKYGIGHSIGAIAILNQAKLDQPFDKIVSIGTIESIENIFKTFLNMFGLSEVYLEPLIERLAQKYSCAPYSMSPDIIYKELKSEALFIHCKNDKEIHFSSSVNLNSLLPNSKLILTEGLGHQRILRDRSTINSMLEFIKN